MICTHLSRASAVLLLLGGLALLFAPDVILPQLIPGFPPAGASLGQLLAAAWLAVGALNWLSQASLLGGIYGRPVVSTNAVLYFMVTTVLLNDVAKRDAPAALYLLLVPIVPLAATYGWLLFRGPFDRDFDRYRRSHAPRNKSE